MPILARAVATLAIRWRVEGAALFCADRISEEPISANATKAGAHAAILSRLTSSCYFGVHFDQYAVLA